jgi:nitric oxide reductase NorE protein
MSTLQTKTAATLNGDRSKESLRGGGARRTQHLPGELGIWVLILGDMTVFALLFGVFVYYRGRQPALFARSQTDLHQTFGAVNTLLLLTGSLFVITAVRAIRAGMRRLAPSALSVALVCGCAFLVNKGLEWSDLLSHGHRPAGNNFFTYFFVLTGIHAFHLLIGMGVLITLFILSRKDKLTPRQFAFVEGGACFWHMVDLLWIVLFALLYLVH